MIKILKHILFRIRVKIWKKPCHYYPCFHKTFFTYYIGSFDDNLEKHNKEMERLIIKYPERSFKLFNGTQKEYTKLVEKRHIDKVSKLKYFINGFQDLNSKYKIVFSRSTMNYYDSNNLVYLYKHWLQRYKNDSNCKKGKHSNVITGMVMRSDGSCTWCRNPIK